MDKEPFSKLHIGSDTTQKRLLAKALNDSIKWAQANIEIIQTQLKMLVRNGLSLLSAYVFVHQDKYPELADKD